jgi:transcriptional regulator with XRE-family HTH domain
MLEMRRAPRRTAFGSLIQAARKAKGWSQEELAEQMGVSRGYIGQVEAGILRQPSNERLAEFERLLGVKPSEMFRALGYPDPDLPANAMSELVRIAALPDENDQIEQLRELPPPIQKAIETLAVALVRRAGRRPLEE